MTNSLAVIAAQPGPLFGDALLKGLPFAMHVVCTRKLAMLLVQQISNGLHQLLLPQDDVRLRSRELLP
jgi:hypothetical protein